MNNNDYAQCYCCDVVIDLDNDIWTIKNDNTICKNCDKE